MIFLFITLYERIKRKIKGLEARKSLGQKLLNFGFNQKTMKEEG